MTVPDCPTDFLWVGLAASFGLLVWLIKMLLNKGIIGRLDEMAKKQDDFFAMCHSNQIANQKQFVHHEDFIRFLGVRAEDHKLLNGKINALEAGQHDIGNTIRVFHEDMAQKMTRLSKTFVFRDAVISMRLDNLSDKVGIDKWTKEKENELANSLKDKFEVEE